MNFGLPDEAVAMIKHQLAFYPQVLAARMFGSRAIGNYRPNSDIDIVIYGEIDFDLHAKILGLLDALPLPYKFDVVNFATLDDDSLKEHIAKYSKELYKKTT